MGSSQEARPKNIANETTGHGLLDFRSRAKLELDLRPVEPHTSQLRSNFSVVCADRI